MPAPTCCVCRLVFAAVAVALLAVRGAGAMPDDAYLAVVQIPSHGASGTVIATGPGETLVLTAAHAFAGAARRRPPVVLVPRPEGTGAEKRVGIRVAAIDPPTDLALLILGTGPLIHTARVAPRGFTSASGWGYSCGYDEMRLPATRTLTRILGTQGPITYTERTPWHGRSGGALFDSRTGYLIGVVQGYTLQRPSVGLYASLGSIQAFLDEHGYGRVIDPAGMGDAENGSPNSPPPAAGPGAFGRRAEPAPARPCPT